MKRQSHVGRKPDIDVRFSHDPSAPQAARRALRPLFAPGDALGRDVTLVASELVSNVIQHTTDGGTMRAWDPSPDVPLRLEVSDRRAEPAAEPLPASDVGGRGLPIVDALSAAWGVLPPEPDGHTTVWAEFERGPADDEPGGAADD